MLTPKGDEHAGPGESDPQRPASYPHLPGKAYCLKQILLKWSYATYTAKFTQSKHYLTNPKCKNRACEG